MSQFDTARPTRRRCPGLFRPLACVRAKEHSTPPPSSLLRNSHWTLGAAAFPQDLSHQLSGFTERVAALSKAREILERSLAEERALSASLRAASEEAARQLGEAQQQRVEGESELAAARAQCDSWQAKVPFLGGRGGEVEGGVGVARRRGDGWGQGNVARANGIGAIAKSFLGRRWMSPT